MFLYIIVDMIYLSLAYRYTIAKGFAVGWFTWCSINLYLSAKATRAWYHHNWCVDLPVGECSYWVGSILDYIFLTSSSFHDGFTLRHVGLIGSIFLFIITHQMQIINELQIRNWYATHNQQEVTEE